MKNKLPEFEEIRKKLRNLNQNGVRALCAVSGVKFSTLNQVRCSATRIPNYGVVEQFYPFLDAMAQDPNYREDNYKERGPRVKPEGK